MAPDDNMHRGSDHEPDTTNARGVALAALGLAVFVFFTIAGSWLFESSFRDQSDVALVEHEPREPGRQTARLTHWENPAEDLAELRARERERLNGYQWIDRDKAIVRIPIERAMELIATRGREPSANASKESNP